MWLFRSIKLLFSKAGRSLPKIWTSGRALFATPKARVVGKWFWRALDVVSIGSLAYDLIKDDETVEGAVRMNDMITDSILNEATVCAINTEFQDDKGIKNALTKNGLALMGSGGLNEVTGMSLVVTAMYMDMVGASRLHYSWSEVKKILNDISAQITDLYKDVLDKEGAEGNADAFSSFIDELEEEDIDYPFRKNLDYLAFFFEQMIGNADLMTMRNGGYNNGADVNQIKNGEGALLN